MNGTAKIRTASNLYTVVSLASATCSGLFAFLAIRQQRKSNDEWEARCRLLREQLQARQDEEAKQRCEAVEWRVHNKLSGQDDQLHPSKAQCASYNGCKSFCPGSADYIREMIIAAHEAYMGKDSE